MRAGGELIGALAKCSSIKFRLGTDLDRRSVTLVRGPAIGQVILFIAIYGAVTVNVIIGVVGAVTCEVYGVSGGGIVLCQV